MIIEEWSNTELEKNQILKITEKVYPNSEFSTSEYFNWQYIDGPYGPAKILLAKNDNGDIIAIEPIMPRKLLIDSSVIMSSLSCNSITDPNFRNQGIFSKLVSNILEFTKTNEISSIYGIPNKKSHSIFIKNGFNDGGKLPLLVRPLKLSNYFSSPIKEIIKPIEAVWKIKKVETNIELFNGEINSEFEKLSKNLSQRVSILQQRDKEFLEWRYNKHPSRNYDIHILKENNELRGYIITRIGKINGKKIGIVLDFVFDSKIKNKNGPKDLVKKVLERFWDKDVSLSIATCASNSLENKVLHEVGFKISPQFLKPEPLYFIAGTINTNSENFKKIKNFKNWFFTLGDYDVF